MDVPRPGHGSDASGQLNQARRSSLQLGLQKFFLKGMARTSVTKIKQTAEIPRAPSAAQARGLQGLRLAKLTPGIKS